MRFPSSNTLHKSFQPRTKWVVKATTAHLEINNNKNRLYPIWPSASLWFQYRCINTHTHTPRFSKSWTLDYLWNSKDCLAFINFKPSWVYSSDSFALTPPTPSFRLHHGPRLRTSCPDPRTLYYGLSSRCSGGVSFMFHTVQLQILI